MVRVDYILYLVTHSTFMFCICCILCNLFLYHILKCAIDFSFEVLHKTIFISLCIFAAFIFISPVGYFKLNAALSGSNPVCPFGHPDCV